MIRLETEAIQRRVEEAIRRGGYTPYVSIFFGDDPSYGGRLGSWDVQQGDGPALTLKASLSGRLPMRFERSLVRMTVEIEGAKVPLIARARADELEPESGNTTLSASSPGAQLADTPLRQRVPYNGAAQHFVVRDAVYRVLDYDRGLVRVAPVVNPLVTRDRDESGDNAFTRSDKAWDILSPLQEQAGWSYKDSPSGGFSGKIAPGLGKVGDVVWEYEADGPGVSFPRPRLEEKQYAAVEVYHLDQNGLPSYDPIVAEVDYGGNRPPSANLVLQIPLDDPSAEIGAQRAFDAARRAASGVRASTISVPFNPLLEPDDAILVREEDSDDDGDWRRVWLGVIQTKKLDHTFRSEFGVRWTILEERLLTPPLDLVGPGRGLVSMRRWGVGLSGYGYVDASLGWVEATPNGGAVLLPDKTGGRVSLVDGYARVRY